jgi:DNA primase
VWGALKARGLVGNGDAHDRPVRGSRYREGSKPISGLKSVSDHRTEALDIWRSTSSADRTTVETYLRSRSIILPVPPCLRYHANLKHWDTGLDFPAIVAGVQDGNGKFTAIQRTYLLPDGRDKAQVNKPKKALGPLGDGAVRLAPARKVLGMAEGIETALSAMQLFEIPVWAALSCSRFASVAIPDNVIEVQIFADNGAPGKGAAGRACDAFTAAGKRVAIRRPPEFFSDWNDALPHWQKRPVGDWEF